MKHCLIRYADVARRLSWIQGLIVSAAVGGAAGGSAAGGALSDWLGRKKALLTGDVLFAAGALLMAAAPGVSVIIAGLLYFHEI